MFCPKKIKYEHPMAACFKRSRSSTQKNADIALKNAALDVFYGPAYKTRLHVFSLSRIF